MRCGTSGTGVVSGASDVLWMSVVLERRGVGRVCEMCMCLAWGCMAWTESGVNG